MVRQHHLGTKAMVAFIAFMNMFIPLSIDLYLPAMPRSGWPSRSGGCCR